MRLIGALFASLLALSTLASPHTWRSAGPAGGEVEALVRASETVWYAAARDGVFASRDGGETWERVTNPGSIAELAVDPRDDRRLYALRSRSAPAPHLFRSLDGGLTWQALENGLPAGTPSMRPVGVVIDPVNPDRVYVASACRDDGWCAAGGLFRSDDRGESWTRLNGVSWPNEFTIDPSSPHTLYVTDMFRGRIRSDDAGISWQSVALAPSVVVRPDPLRPWRRYGIGDLPLLMVSEDGGSSWIGGEVKVLSGEAIPKWLFSRLEIDPTTGRLFLGTATLSVGGGLFRSGDGGANWLPVGGEGREPIRQLHFEEEAATLTIGTPSGVYRSSGFPWESWRALDIGNSTRVIHAVTVHPEDPRSQYATGFNRLFLSDDGGRSWRQRGGPMPLIDGEAPEARGIAVGSGGDVFVIVRTGSYALLKLSARSDEWQVLDPPSFNSLSIAGGPSVSIVLSAGQSLLVSRDGGVSWDRRGAPATPTSVTIAPGDDDRLYLTTASGLFTSGDEGRTWSRAPLEASVFSTPVAVSAAKPATLLVAARVAVDQRVIARSIDGGTSWQLLDASQLDFWSENSLIADPVRAGQFYLLTPSNLYRSVDSGASWETLTGGLPPPPYLSIAIGGDGGVHVGTTFGVWTLQTVGRSRSVRGR